jgi:hypothetical protein
MTNFSLLSFVLLIGLSTSSQVLAYQEFKAESRYTSTHFYKNRSAHSINDSATFEAESTFIADDEKHAQLFLKLRLKIDGLDSDRNRYLPNEAFLKLYGTKTELTAGLKLTPLGVAETNNPTDVFTRYDFGDNFYDPASLGDFTIDGQFTFDQAGPLTELTLRAVLQPLFLETPLPGANSRFAISGEASGIPYSLFPDQQNPTFADGLSTGLVLSAKWKSLDWNLLYFHGPERTPGFFLHINDVGALTLEPFYFSINAIGGNLRTSLGDFVLKAEAIYKSTDGNGFVAHEAFLADNAVPASYFAFVLGLDYTLTIGKGELKLLAEYLGENAHNNAFNNYRPFKNDLAIGAEYLFNDRRLSHLQAGFIKDLGNAELIVRLEGETKVYKECKLGLRWTTILKDSDPSAPLSLFDNNSYVEATLSYAFGKRWEKK